jgi:hypothetical protein
MAAFLLFIVPVLMIKWLGMLIPQSLAYARGDTNGVLFMDLTIVLPIFAIVAVMLLKNRSFFVAAAGAPWPGSSCAAFPWRSRNSTPR